MAEPSPDARTRATASDELPLRKLPLVFAVDNGDGTTENIWGVDIVRGQPIVYCGCRYPFDDGMWRERRAGSLLLNGQNQKSLAPGMLTHLHPGECLWLRWPTAREAEGFVTSWTLYFPIASWNLRLSKEERMRRAWEFPEWRDPHVLIDRCEADEVDAVSMLQVPKGQTVHRIDGHQVSPIGVVPFSLDSSLHVVTAKESREMVDGVRERGDALLSGGQVYWSEDEVDELFATMGSDEVGYATMVRKRVAVE